MPKITGHGVSYEPGREPAGWHERPGTGVPMVAVEHPADGTWSPPVANADGETVQAAVTVFQPGEPVPPAPVVALDPAEPEAAPKPAPARAPKKADSG
ncbi:MAG: hypothetical protein ACRDRJ_09195 [Streptosporangiaceae bacterium]